MTDPLLFLSRSSSTVARKSRLAKEPLHIPSHPFSSPSIFLRSLPPRLLKVNLKEYLSLSPSTDILSDKLWPLDGSPRHRPSRHPATVSFFAPLSTC
jgi:hypothetical protein